MEYIKIAYPSASAEELQAQKKFGAMPNNVMPFADLRDWQAQTGSVFPENKHPVPKYWRDEGAVQATERGEGLSLRYYLWLGGILDLRSANAFSHDTMNYLGRPVIEYYQRLLAGGDDSHRHIPTIYPGCLFAKDAATYTMSGPNTATCPYPVGYLLPDPTGNVVIGGSNFRSSIDPYIGFVWRDGVMQAFRFTPQGSKLTAEEGIVRILEAVASSSASAAQRIQQIRDILAIVK